MDFIQREGGDVCCATGDLLDFRENRLRGRKGTIVVSVRWKPSCDEGIVRVDAGDQT
jgi:hypothetical protein